VRRGFLIFNHGTMLTSLSESVAVVIAAREAASEYCRECGVNTPGWTRKHN
jgi:hypothetical protein